MKERTKSSRKKRLVLKMGKNQLFNLYDFWFGYSLEHPDSSFLRSKSTRQTIEFVAGIAAIAIVAGVVYYWVVGKAIADPMWIPLSIAAVAVALYIIDLLFYLLEQLLMYNAKLFMGEVNDAFPGFHEFYLEHREDGFVPMHELFPLPYDYLDVVAEATADDAFERGQRVTEETPRYINDEQSEVIEEAIVEPLEEPLALPEQSTGIDIDTLYSDPTVARLLSEPGEPERMENLHLTPEEEIIAMMWYQEQQKEGA